MARPERNDVDYFPFLCKEGKAMFYIEQTYGNDGYATWVKILRQLAVTNYHYLNLQDKVEFMFLSSKCRVSQETLNSIINDLCDLGEFNKNLWEESRILFNEKLVSNLKDAYDKRNNNCITLTSLLPLLDSLGIRKLSNDDKKLTNNPHSKVEYTKVEKNTYRSFDHLSILNHEVDSLKSQGYTQFQIDSILDSIQNYKKNKSYKSLYLTAKKWLEKESKSSQPESQELNLTKEEQNELDAYFNR